MIRPRAGRGPVLGIICTAQFAVILSTTNALVAIPSIQQDLSIDGDQLVWVLNSYSLMFGALLLVGGRCADVLGRRRTFLGGLGIFGTASGLAAISSSPTWLFVVRAVEGAGAAMIVPAALSMLTTSFVGAERRRALATWGAVNAGAAGVALLLGGVAVDAIGWRYVFLLNMAIVIPVALTAARRIPRLRAERRGGLGLSIALVGVMSPMALLAAASVATSQGWWDWKTLATLGIFGLTLVLLAVTQRRSHTQLIRPEVLRSRAVLAAVLTAGIVAGVPVTVFYLTTLHLQYELGYSALETGVVFLPITAALLIGSYLAHRIGALLGARASLVGTVGLVLCGGVALALGGSADLTVGLTLGTAVATFVGIGGATVLLLALAMTTLPAGDSGVVSGLLNTSTYVGAAVWLSIIAAIANAADGEGYDARAAFWAVTVLAALALMVIVALSPSRWSGGSSSTVLDTTEAGTNNESNIPLDEIRLRRSDAGGC